MNNIGDVVPLRNCTFGEVVLWRGCAIPGIQDLDMPRENPARDLEIPEIPEPRYTAAVQSTGLAHSTWLNQSTGFTQCAGLT